MPLEFAHQHNGRFQDPGPWRHPVGRPLELTAPLGLETLPAQRFSKVKRASFGLNLMVVGESGLGKTTFMNTLFNTDLKEEILPKKIHSTQTVSIQPAYYELVEDGVLLNLCIVDTPGFGDELNREHNLTPIIQYIDQQFEEYMAAERHPGVRKAIPDTRIHAILYFIAPTGHGLKELDVKALKTLSQKVNVIPIIAKADTMTAEEKLAFKKILLTDLEAHQIKSFPTSYRDHVDGGEELFKHIPFSVIGSDNFQVIGGRRVRARSYRWGVVEVENTEHSDFVYLRELLLVTCLHDLVDSTHGVHYHEHRAKALRSNGRPASILECDDSYEARIEGTRFQTREEMNRREEEIRQSFIEKVQETEIALRQREEQLNAKKAEMIAELEQYKALIEAEQREVDELLASSRPNTLSKNSSKLFRAK
ncbi:Septin-domain-containing protein [Gamsiella multidivaricata]|uniref:Septin-domain-containing protein n=1 Tax=Gamsiella multidivaricata TaxID=101098 RepID=UPI002220D139|nr:Septin-domain-containing protein [Gamsiella multidivaricata]KAI7831230.1 Septin-domain-containing protein [Gamsiella multidivaricata]